MKGKFGFIPVYLFIIWPLIRKSQKFPSDQNKTINIIAKLGYNFFAGDNNYKGIATLQGELFYAMGLSIINRSFQIEILYAKQKGSIKIYKDLVELSNINLDVLYSRVCLALGFRL